MWPTDRSDPGPPLPNGRLDPQIGLLREIGPAQVIRAAGLVQRGEVYDLSHILDEQAPAFPGRSFRQHLDITAHHTNRRRPDAGKDGWGENGLNWVIETVESTSQMGTHLDGLNHLQIGERCYGGYALPDIVEAWGTNKLGLETVPQIVTRGLLVNVARQRGVERLGRGEVITVQEVLAALQDSGLTLERGDVLLFHTGWGAYWATDNAHYLSGQPGPGLELAEWMVAQGVVLTGSDTWSFGPVPPEHPRRPFEVPQTLNVEHGLFIVENLHTAELAEGHTVRAFMFVLSHARLRGATGAWVAPLAVV